MNATLQREIDDLAPAVKAWDQRERAFDFVLRARPHQIEIALIEWAQASHELVTAHLDLAARADARRQVDALEIEVAA